MLIILQSKKSASTGTHTLDYALEEMAKDLKNSGVRVEGRDHVEGKLHDMYAAQRLGSMPSMFCCRFASWEQDHYCRCSFALLPLHAP